MYANSLSDPDQLLTENMTHNYRFLVVLFIPILAACSYTASLVNKDVPTSGSISGSLAGFCSFTPDRSPSTNTYSNKASSNKKSSIQASHELQRTENPLVGQFKFPIPEGCLSSPFGYRRGIFHSGVDITADKGDPILACADGTVIFAGTMKAYRRYGQMVLIGHGGDVYTRYAHASRVLVRSGQKVRLGDKIALVGSTGRATSPHLHLEVQVAGKLYNPVACFSSEQLRQIRVAKNFPSSPMGPVSAGRRISDLLSSLR